MLLLLWLLSHPRLHHLVDLKSPNDRVLSHAIFIIIPLLCSKTSLHNVRSMGSCALESVSVAPLSASCWTAAALRRAIGAVTYRSVAVPRAGCSLPVSWASVEPLRTSSPNEATLAGALHDEVARMQYRCTGNEFCVTVRGAACASACVHGSCNSACPGERSQSHCGGASGDTSMQNCGGARACTP